MPLPDPPSKPSATGRRASARRDADLGLPDAEAMELTEVGQDTQLHWSRSGRAPHGADTETETASLTPFATSLNTIHTEQTQGGEGLSVLTESSAVSDLTSAPAADPAAGSVAERAVAELTAAGLIAAPAAEAAGRGVLGVVAGRYELRRLLGAGGRGLVFLAYDRQGDCRVALKTLRPEFLDQAAARKVFVGEAKEMNRIPAHAGVLVVKDFGGVDQPFYVTEYLRGGTLGDAIREDGPLEASRVLRYARDLVGALAYMHARHGKLHRDVKPANVLLDGDGSARLADFGLVWRVGAGGAGFRAGTLPYMPPEVLRGEGKNVGFEWDVYGFGATLYEMLTGVAPYADRLKTSPENPGGASEPVTSRLRKMVVASAPTPILALNRQADRGLAQVADWAMARDPRARYFGTGDIVEDLERVAQGQRPQGPVRGSVDLQQRGRGWGRWAAIVGLAFGVGAAASLLLLGATPYAPVKGGGPRPGSPAATPNEPTQPTEPAAADARAAGPMLSQSRRVSPLGLSFEAVGGTDYRIGPPERWAQLRGQRWTSVNDLPWDPVAQRAALAFVARSERGAYLTVLSRASDGTVLQLLPNVFEPDNRLDPGVARAVPRPLAEGRTPYWFEAAPPAGTDTVWAVLTQRPFEIVGQDARALPGAGFRVVPEDFKIAVGGRVFDSFEDAFGDRWQTTELTVTVSPPGGP